MAQADRWTPAEGARALSGRFGHAQALELLIKLLAGVPPMEMLEGDYAAVLAHIGNGHAKQVLARWRGDPLAPRLDHWPRSWAARAMAYLGDRAAAPALSEALRDEHWRVRMTAASSLGRLDVRDFETGLRAALTDPHQRVRRAAAAALGRVGTEASKQALQRALDDDDREVRAEADKALSVIRARSRSEPT
ncbi:MAG: HEAT repeat domain-containing protein [Trueperaceae bacterium]|nr:HEAT repeat domain-containing protein [Trueperaceae bacterium]